MAGPPTRGRWWRGVRIVVCWVHQAGCLRRVSLLVGTAAVLAAAVWMATAGVSVTWCLLIVTLAPAVTVVGYEALGYRCLAAVLNRNLARS